MKLRIALFSALAAFTVGCGSDQDIVPGATPYNIENPGILKNYEFKSPEDNAMTVEGVELGRMLFYEKRLSANNTMSCGTCHQQKHAFTDGLAVSKGVDGIAGTRSTMALINLAWDKNLMWDGSFKTLEAQIKGPIENPVEMHQQFTRGVNKLQNTETYPKLFLKAFGSKVITEENIRKAIAQFERTLMSGNSRYDQYLNSQAFLTPDELAGENLFNIHPEPQAFNPTRGGDCNHCHGGHFFNKNIITNNGLDESFTDFGFGGVTGKPTDNGKFKAPTLRNIALTAPYMHDGRFKTLEEVLDHYSDHVKKNSPNLDPEISSASNNAPGDQLKLTETEKKQIIAFLHTLTDESFTTDPRFSDPFEKTGMVK